MEKRKNKKKKWLAPVLLLALLAALLAGYGALSGANRRAEEEAALAAEEDGIEVIAEYDSTTASALSFASPTAGEALSFAKENGSWVYVGDPDFPLDGTALDRMAAAMSQIGVTRSVEEGIPADYGLETPAYTLTIRYDSNVERVYKIGDYNSFSDGYYFMTGDRIYLIPEGLTAYFDVALPDLALLDTLPGDIETEYITSIEVRTEDGTSTVTTGAEELYAVVSQLNYTNPADYSADRPDEEYGIDGVHGITVSYKRTVTSTDESGNATSTRVNAVYEIQFGGQSEDGSVYYTKKGSDIIYTVTAEVYSNLMTAVEGALAAQAEEEEA